MHTHTYITRTLAITLKIALAHTHLHTYTYTYSVITPTHTRALALTTKTYITVHAHLRAACIVHTHAPCTHVAWIQAGWTPLTRASVRGHCETVEVLLKVKADANIKDNVSQG